MHLCLHLTSPHLTSPHLTSFFGVFIPQAIDWQIIPLLFGSLCVPHVYISFPFGMLFILLSLTFGVLCLYPYPHIPFTFHPTSIHDVHLHIGVCARCWLSLQQWIWSESDQQSQAHISGLGEGPFTSSCAIAIQQATLNHPMAI